MFNFFGTVIKIIRVVFLTVPFAIKAKNQSIKDPYTFFNISRVWAKKLLKITNVDVEIIGIEKLDKNNHYLFAANHSSLFDIPILLSTLPVDLAIVYKKELEKVPIFGKSLIASPFIGIERESAKGARLAIKNTLSLFNDSKSVLLFPEGTRSSDGNLLPLKEGIFFIAKATKHNIVPLTIIGSHKLLERGKFKIYSGKVKLIISEAVEPNIESVEKVLKENLKTFAE